VHCLLAGVVIAGAALYATTRTDKVGGAARGVGGAAATTYDKAAESAEKHHVGEKISAASHATYHKAKEIDSQYHITDNVKHATAVAALEAKKLNDRYDITGKSSRAMAAGAKSVYKFIESSSSGHSDSSSPAISDSTTGGSR
jgi:hypothetical protein